MHMPWLPSLNTGVSVLDNEHRYLFEVLEELGANVTACNLSGLRVLLDELHTSTLEHFRGEEALMVRYLYPDRGAHMAEHARARATLAQLETHLQDGRLELFTDTLAEFTASYFHGVLIHDGLFGRFLQDHGYEEAAHSATLVRSSGSSVTCQATQSWKTVAH